MKKIPKKPIRYRRPTPKHIAKQVINMNEQLETGVVLEFTYGRKQKVGEVGGWKNDPRPTLLIFYDDGQRYLEGVNTNYLSNYYLKKLYALKNKFPGINGEEFYDIVKRSAPYALKKGYRKYLRPSVKRPMKYVFDYIQPRNTKGQFIKEN